MIVQQNSRAGVGYDIHHVIESLTSFRLIDSSHTRATSSCLLPLIWPSTFFVILQFLRKPSAFQDEKLLADENPARFAPSLFFLTVLWLSHFAMISRVWLSRYRVKWGDESIAHFFRIVLLIIGRDSSVGESFLSFFSPFLEGLMSDDRNSEKRKRKTEK